MPFQKGHKLATGRPKGSKDVKTGQWDVLGDYITRKGAERYLNALITLEDKDYVDRYEKVLEYFKPKLARSDNKNDNTGEINVNIVNYSDKHGHKPSAQI